MTDDEKKKRKEKSWIEEFLSYMMMQCAQVMIDQFFDEWLGWHYVNMYENKIDLDEIEEQDLIDFGGWL